MIKNFRYHLESFLYHSIYVYIKKKREKERQKDMKGEVAGGREQGKEKGSDGRRGENYPTYILLR